MVASNNYKPHYCYDHIDLNNQLIGIDSWIFFQGIFDIIAVGYGIMNNHTISSSRLLCNLSSYYGMDGYQA